MDNQFYTQIAPYFQQQDQGLGPVFQNIGAQQAMQNAALQQQLQNNQAASQIGQQGGGINPLAMAAMLRGKQDPYAMNKGDPYANAQTASNIYGAQNVYGFGGQGQVPIWNGEM